MSVLGAGFILILTITLAGLAQYYKVLSEKLAESLLAAHAWVDEIIQALENTNVQEGDAHVERLLSDHPGVDPDRSGS